MEAKWDGKWGVTYMEVEIWKSHKLPFASHWQLLLMRDHITKYYQQNAQYIEMQKI